MARPFQFSALLELFGLIERGVQNKNGDQTTFSKNSLNSMERAVQIR